MNKTKIISALLFLALTACRTDVIVSEYNYQVSNYTGTEITIEFNRGGIDNKTFAIGVKDTVVIFNGSGFEGDIPSVYDYAFLYQKDKVYIDSLKNARNSLLDTDNYIEYKKTTIKGIEYVYKLFTVDSIYIGSKMK
ncbi:MAG: hypothetical protein JXC36_05975 [Candidatus Atribacteria bacterium]|jgi:hypothetical protein|nr:hypothetical protein [Candidatus Atribacteria bacterium]